jgi:hypothetical protein
MLEVSILIWVLFEIMSNLVILMVCEIFVITEVIIVNIYFVICCLRVIIYFGETSINSLVT